MHEQVCRPWQVPERMPSRDLAASSNVQFHIRTRACYSVNALNRLAYAAHCSREPLKGESGKVQ